MRDPSRPRLLGCSSRIPVIAAPRRIQTRRLLDDQREGHPRQHACRTPSASGRRRQTPVSWRLSRNVIDSVGLAGIEFTRIADFSASRTRALGARGGSALRAECGFWNASTIAKKRQAPDCCGEGSSGWLPAITAAAWRGVEDCDQAVRVGVGRDARLGPRAGARCRARTRPLVRGAASAGAGVRDG